MDRVIKFRAWHKKLKRMYENVTTDLLKDENLEFMQYIGLKDKNNREICEKDIVLVPDGWGGDNYYPAYIAIIDYEEAEFICNPINDYNCQTFSWNEVEVIGNIYENPDLIIQNNKNQ